ncbi:MAG: FAD-binding oxidoreductase [Chlorobi bacterium]|nr:FAD-binding oxidoreductase [Chlorobiota bacterium]MCI0716265.1 FAD-binding oxidoreductase [Chlorobiota bacterium]
MKPAEVLIIGGGVIGASIAYHLASRGFKKILVIDKELKPGMGSTGKATGGFRAQFGSEINVKLSLLARQKLLSFKDEFGIDPGFQQSGYLFLAQNDYQLTLLRKANSLQKSSGLNEAEIVTLDEIKKLNPHINYNGITGGAFCSADGFINPLQILNGYIKGAQELGVVFEYGKEVKGFVKKGDNIKSVVTTSGSVKASIVINAAGAWAGEISRLTDYDIPVKPLKRQAAKIAEKDILPPDLPMTIWIDNSFHFRIREGYVIMLLPAEPQSADTFNTDVESSWLEKVFNIAKERIPKLKNCRIDNANSIAGLYEMSPDEHVMLGKVHGLENFYLACGSSGHGVMHSPVIGQLMAELIADGKTSIDVDILNPKRFLENKPLQSIKFF